MCPADVSKVRAVPLRSTRLTLEQLEDRTMPTNFTAASVADLLAAINAANQAGGANTITLVAGKTFELKDVDNTTDGPTGLPVIAANDSLTIVGSQDIIKRSLAADTPAFRLLDVTVGASLTLRNVTLQGGLAYGSGVSAQGGAIYSEGSLDLYGVIVKNNSAEGQDGVKSRSASKCAGKSAAGGGIYSRGTLILEGGTRMQGNLAVGGGGSDGGSVWVASGRDRDLAPAPPGAGGGGIGGGLCVAGGTVTIKDATFLFNHARGGTGGSGGVFYSRVFDGAPGGQGRGGGLYVSSGTVSISDAKAVSNLAQGGTGGKPSSGAAGTGGDGAGADLFTAGGTVTVHNYTASGNRAQLGRDGASSKPSTSMAETHHPRPFVLPTFWLTSLPTDPFRVFALL